MVSDSNGIPLAIRVTPGEAHESKSFENTINAVRISRRQTSPVLRPGSIAGDKGYSYPRIRAWLKNHKIKDVIPTRSNQKADPEFDKKRYRDRNVIERCIGWLKECRRIATRFEKLALRYVAMLKLAIIREYLKYELSDTA